MVVTSFSSLREQAGVSIDQLAEQVGFAARTLYRWENGECEPRQAAILVLENIIRERARKKTDSKFRFIDLFAGIGGLRRGFDAIGGECVFTSEWNKYAAQTYRANYPLDGHDVSGDITEIEAGDIPEHDVLLAGFPCQPFSIAGVSKKNSLGREHGFRCDAQGTLFFDVARIIERHRPKAFLLENVKNLKSHDGGRTFEVILRTLKEELGYNVQTRIIDAKSFVPQHRERIFIVGFRDGCDFDFDALTVPDVAGGPKIRSVLHTEDGHEPFDNHFIDPDNGKVLDKYTLSDKLWQYLQDYAKKHQAKGNGFGFGLVGPDDTARTLSARYYKDGSEILVSRGKNRNPRRLTPRECARLMGFEKPGQADFIIPVSDTQAYKQFGNAVVVPVIEAIARHMEPYILEAVISPEIRQSA